MTPERELESEEDDEAPEEVTFQNARSQAEKSARLRREASRKEKADLKKKRKLKQELFSEQKKKKLLSDDLLQTVSALEDQPPKPSEHLDKPEEKADVEKKPKGKHKLLKLRPRKRLQSNYKVVHLKKSNTADPKLKNAKDFLNRKLYGKDRTTADKILNFERKKAEIKGPAVKFTDNSWEKEKKEKAARINLQWLSKKKFQ